MATVLVPDEFYRSCADSVSSGNDIEDALVRTCTPSRNNSQGPVDFANVAQEVCSRRAPTGR